MSSDSLQRRLLELQSKIQQGQEAMREWADLQIQLNGPSIVAGNANPYMGAVRSIHPQNPPQQEAGPSHPPVANLSVQQRPPAPNYTPNHISQAQSTGAPVIPSFPQPQTAQSSDQAQRGQNMSIPDARSRAAVQVPHVPTPPNQSVFASLPAGLDDQARKMVNAAHSRNTAGYAVPRQQHPDVITPAHSAQPMHVMQVAPQQPLNGAPPIQSTFHSSKKPWAAIPQHQPYYRSPEDSVSSKPQPAPVQVTPPARINRSIGQLPEWTDQELYFFKNTLESWRGHVQVGSSFDIAQFFPFGHGFSIRKLADGLYVEDNIDKLKCHVSALYEQLERRKKPSSAPQVEATPNLNPQATAQARPLPWSKSSTSSTSSTMTAQPFTPPTQSHAAVTVSNSAFPVQASGSTSAPQPPTPALHAPQPSNPKILVSISKLSAVATPVPISSTAKPSSSPATPRRQISLQATVSCSPANANKKTLARDLLFALGKRPRPSNEQTPGPPAKRPTVGTSAGPSLNSASAVVDEGVLHESRPTLPPSTGGVPSSSERNSPVTSVAAASTDPPSLPASAPQDIADPASTLNPAVTVETSQSSRPTQAIQNLPATATASAPTVALEVRSQSRGPEHFASSPSLPPIAILDEVEVASLSSRPASPIRAQKAARSPSISASDFAPYPPPSSKGTVSDVSEAGPSSSKMMVVEARSSPVQRRASPAKSVSSDDSEPLFLPSESPPGSPGFAYRVAQPQKIATASKGKGKEKERKQVYVYIQASPRTRSFVEWHHREWHKEQLRQETTSSQASRSTSTLPTTKPRQSSSRPVGAPNMLELDLWPLEEEDEKEYDYSYDAQGNKIEDPNERMLMEQACTQLQPLPCKWDGCDVVMNSAIGILLHLKKQHRPVTKDGNAHFSCRWSQCGKQCRQKDNKHFVKHALENLTCPYTGCHEGFRTVGQLRRHANSHPDTDEFKPTCKPFAPTNLVPPPAAPDVLPSFMVVTRPVRPASISPALHDQLYPKVLKKVKGLVKRSKPPIRLEQYSFLTDYPMRASSYLSQPAEGVKIEDMDWTVRLTELCRQDRVTLFDEGSRRVVIARTPTPELPDQLDEEVQEEEQISLGIPSESEGFDLEEARSSSQEPFGQSQVFLEQGEEEEDGDEIESEMVSVGHTADIDEGDEAGESDLVASLLL